MEFVFVDTSAWCAYFDRSELTHSTLANLMNNLSHPLVTTNYIVDETLTLLRNRLGHSATVTIGKHFFSGNIAQVERITEVYEKSAFALFTQYADKSFSFTDCTSFVVMRNLEINRVLTLDKHFQQMGFQKIPESLS